MCVCACVIKKLRELAVYVPLGLFPAAGFDALSYAWEGGVRIARKTMKCVCVCAFGRKKRRERKRERVRVCVYVRKCA